jgi:hypothetical protein
MEQVRVVNRRSRDHLRIWKVPSVRVNTPGQRRLKTDFCSTPSFYLFSDLFANAVILGIGESLHPNQDIYSVQRKSIDDIMRMLEPDIQPIKTRPSTAHVAETQPEQYMRVG